MKIEVNVDMEDFIERWGEQNLESSILEDIKLEALRVVKQTPEYKAMLKRQIDSMMDNIQS